MIIGKRVRFRQKEHNNEGVLVAFGITYEELRDGIGHYTTAVIMKDDGEIIEHPVQCVKVILESA